MILPVSLAGRCANGFERDRGSIVHLLEASEFEAQFGIRYYARSLCGKTHGARSAGWSTCYGQAATCARCARIAMGKP